MIGIIDYGMGNIHSVQKALEVSGAKTIVTSTPSEIEGCDKVVLPGVGAFDDAMQELKKMNFISLILKYVESKRPFLGICLGMQLLFESSEEAPGTQGLGILRGAVRRFQQKGNLKVPHMGWNQLRISKGGCPLLNGISDNSFVYFCHSYYPQNRDSEVTAAVTDYGASFTSAVWKENVFGVQFHPEKSQSVGLQMLRNFVNAC